MGRGWVWGVRGASVGVCEVLTGVDDVGVVCVVVRVFRSLCYSRHPLSPKTMAAKRAMKKAMKSMKKRRAARKGGKKKSGMKKRRATIGG